MSSVKCKLSFEFRSFEHALEVRKDLGEIHGVEDRNNEDLEEHHVPTPLAHRRKN